MNKLIIVTGEIATGKSFYSTIISSKYDLICFNKDTIKEVLGDTIGFDNREDNIKLSKATFELMKYSFKELSKHNTNLVLEANFHTNEISSLIDIARVNEYDVLVMYLYGKEEVLYNRYIKRMNEENRHRVHLSTTLDRYKDFLEYLEKARSEEKEIEKEYYNLVKIEASTFSYQNDIRIYEIIEKFLIS